MKSPKHKMVIYVYIVFISIITSTSLWSAGHIGRIGDAINYKTGELSFAETDVTVRGRNGLDISITRLYSSHIYKSSMNDYTSEFILGDLKDSSLFNHLGRNWRIEFLSLRNVNDREILVHRDGTMEALFYVIDTLIIDTTVNPHDSIWTSTKNDSLLTRKTRDFSLLTGFGVGDSTPDTMLMVGGTKIIFGHLVDSVKHMTHKINSFGDTLTVEYHDSTSFIKRVVSPIGRDVKFVYGKNDTLLDYDSIPSSSHRLYQLQYKNYLDSTITVNYRYSFKDEYLSYIIYPMGDTAKYEYSDTLKRNDETDWAWGPNTVDYFDYANDYDTLLSDSGKLLSKYTSPSGASVEFKYRSMLFPIYSSESEYQHRRDWPQSCFPDTCYTIECPSVHIGFPLYCESCPDSSMITLEYDCGETVICGGAYCKSAPITQNPSILFDFLVYPAVYQRIADEDTLSIRFEMIHEVLSNRYFASLVGAKTTVNLPSGGQEIYDYNVDFYREYDPALFTITPASLFYGGFDPGGLVFKASIYDNDTICIAFSNPRMDQAIIGVYSDTIIDTSEYSWWNGVGISDTTIIDTLTVGPEVYAPYRSGVTFGVDYVKSWGDGYQVFNNVLPKKRYTKSYNIIDVNAVGFPVYSVTGQFDSTFYDEYAKDFSLNTWGEEPFPDGPNTLEDSAIYYTPALYPNDSLSFVKDSVVEYEYIPRLNRAVLKKVRHTIQNGKYYYSYIEEYEHDTVFYQVTESRTYNEVDTTNAFTTKFIYDDTTHNLLHTISPLGDTTTIIYDALYNQLVIAELNSRVADTLYKNEYYGTSFKLKSTTDLNGATTYYYYDFYGRDSVVKSPLETDFSIKKIHQKDSLWNASIIKIDSGQELYTRSYYDKYFQNVKSMLKINDSVSVIDTTVFNSLGQAVKSARSVFNAYDSTSTIWANLFYREDQSHYKTVLPNNGSTFSTRIDELTHMSTNQQGLRKTKSITYKDYDGNVLKTLTIVDSFYIDTSSNATIYEDVDTIKMTFEYGKYNNLLKSTDAKGFERSYEYDQYGRQVKIIDPDIGTTRTWYDQWGKIRFVKRNNEDSSYYYKYDDLFRVLEEGLVYNPDTLQVDSSSYPTSGNTKVVLSYRYDSYNAYQTDTIGGLSNSKGRLTEITYNNINFGLLSVYIGYFYDKRGRLGKLIQEIPGLSIQKIRYEYYANNALKKIIYPDSTFTEYSLNDAGQTIGISDVIGLDSVSYEAWGAVKDVLYQNGIKTKNSYDILGRNTKTLNYTKVGSTELNFFSRQYVFENGFMKEEYDLDTLGDTTSYGMIRSYGYDLFGRLDSAFLKDPNGSASNRTANYSYDLNNNLNSKNISGVASLAYIRFDSLNCDSILRFDNDSIYVYNRNDRGLIAEITQYNDTIPAGIIGYRKTMTYNLNNQMTMLVTTLGSYQFGDGPDTLLNIYNAFGQKIRQQFTYQRAPEFGRIWDIITENKYYVWSGGKIVLEYDNQTTTPSVNVYGLGKMLAKKFYDGSSWKYDYFITNKYGSVVSLIRDDGIPRDWRIEYYPYGDIYSVNGQNYSDKSFGGKEKDNTGELDFGPRYYSVTSGRFLGPDPILSSPSPYSYALGNPVMMFDPTGFEDKNAIAKAIWWTKTLRKYGLKTKGEYYQYMAAKRESAERRYFEGISRQVQAQMDMGRARYYEFTLYVEIVGDKIFAALPFHLTDLYNSIEGEVSFSPLIATVSSSNQQYVSTDSEGNFIGEQGEGWDFKLKGYVLDVEITVYAYRNTQWLLPANHNGYDIIGKYDSDYDGFIHKKYDSQTGEITEWFRTPTFYSIPNARPMVRSVGTKVLSPLAKSLMKTKWMRARIGKAGKWNSGPSFRFGLSKEDGYLHLAIRGKFAEWLESKLGTSESLRDGHLYLWRYLFKDGGY